MRELDLPEYALRFFTAFARFEYAVKSAGHVDVTDRGHVITKWDEFAERAEIASLLSQLAENPDTSYLIQHPPKKQILDQSRLDWSAPPPPVESMKDLMVMLRRVRNNLFHGSKRGAGTERDEQLLTAGEATIWRLLEACPDVFGEFQGH